MTASTPTTVSPSSVRIARNTPWADGCCGPMFITRRSLPPYPISTVCRVGVLGAGPERSRSESVELIPLRRSLHRRHGGPDQDRRLHHHQHRPRLAEEPLPVGILQRPGPRGRPLVEILVDPEVDGLVELTGLGLPVAHVARILLTGGQHPLGQAQPLRKSAYLGAVPA